MRLLLGPGQRQDITRAHELIEGFRPEAVIADKGYDADHLLAAIREAKAEPVIPARANRRQPRPHDEVLYKERNRVERFLLQAEAVPPRRHPLRQAAGQLRGLRPARRHRDPAQMKSSPRPKENQVLPWSGMPVWIPGEGETFGFHRQDIHRAIAAGPTHRPLPLTATDTLDWLRTLSPERQARLRAGIVPERETVL